jgi:hypothetical protein
LKKGTGDANGNEFKDMLQQIQRGEGVEEIAVEMAPQ